MLGLCWTPAAIQGMQKMAATMPSNPEQLLGAILVRKDIFHRFEMTMHDTCLDANNLLEYLFSLYNSTAAPAEQDSLPPPHDFEVNRRDSNKHKKGTARGQHTFPHQPNMVNSQSAVQGRLLDATQGHQSRSTNGRRKKIKIDQSNCLEGDSFADQHQEYNKSISLKPFDSLQVFPSASNNPPSCIKMEVTPEEVESHYVQSSPLPPFSQLTYHGGKPYSPASSHFSDALTTLPHENSHHNLEFIADGNASADVKIEIEGALQGVLNNQQMSKVVHGTSKRTKKLKRKGPRTQSVDGTIGSCGEYTGRRRKAHQCFCGALFTRADNLKRHIRKCHEEKLEKLSANPIDFDIDNNNVPVEVFSQAFPSSDQEALDSSQLHESKDPEQQVEEHEQHKENSLMKSVAEQKLSLSCFCGENFTDHCQLVEHAKSHEKNT